MTRLTANHKSKIVKAIDRIRNEVKAALLEAELIETGPTKVCLKMELLKLQQSALNARSVLVDSTQIR